MKIELSEDMGEFVNKCGKLTDSDRTMECLERIIRNTEDDFKRSLFQYCVEYYKQDINRFVELEKLSRVDNFAKEVMTEIRINTWSIRDKPLLEYMRAKAFGRYDELPTEAVEELLIKNELKTEEIDKLIEYGFLLESISLKENTSTEQLEKIVDQIVYLRGSEYREGHNDYAWDLAENIAKHPNSSTKALSIIYGMWNIPFVCSHKNCPTELIEEAMKAAKNDEHKSNNLQLRCIAINNSLDKKLRMEAWALSNKADLSYPISKLEGHTISNNWTRDSLKNYMML